MSTISRLEQETIIIFNEAEDKAEVCTYNGRLKSRMVELSEQRPDSVMFKDNAGGAATYIVPKNWIKINPTRILSDAQKKTIVQRLRH